MANRLDEVGLASLALLDVRQSQSGRIRVGRYAPAIGTTREWCAVVDGEYMRASGPSRRVRTFTSAARAFVAAELEVCRG